MKPTMVIADDHPILRAAVASGIAARAGFEVVACAEDVPSAMKACLEHRPGVLLLDIEMPGGDAFDGVRELARRLPECRVVMFTAHLKRDILERAIAAGASGYLLKDDPSDALVDLLVSLGTQGQAFSRRVRDLTADAG